MSVIAIVIVAALVGLVLYFISLYNLLIRKRNEVDNAFAQISVQLERRYDLIPNLVEVAKRYLKHEQETLVAVMEARNVASAALKSGQLQRLSQANEALTAGLNALFATVEAYPELKADQQMTNLHEELTSTENRIAFARQYYNDCVTDYNNNNSQFPANLIAAFFHFRPGQVLAVEAAKLAPVRVQF